MAVLDTSFYSQITASKDNHNTIARLLCWEGCALLWGDRQAGCIHKHNPILITNVVRYQNDPKVVSQAACYQNHLLCMVHRGIFS